MCLLRESGHVLAHKCCLDLRLHEKGDVRVPLLFRACMHARANKGMSVKSHRQSVVRGCCRVLWAKREAFGMHHVRSERRLLSGVCASSVVGTSGLPNNPLTNSRLPIPMLRGHLNQTVESFVVCCCMVTLCHSTKSNRAPCELQHVRASGKLECQCVRTMPGEHRETHRSS